MCIAFVLPEMQIIGLYTRIEMVTVFDRPIKYWLNEANDLHCFWIADFVLLSQTAALRLITIGLNELKDNALFAGLYGVNDYQL